MRNYYPISMIGCNYTIIKELLGKQLKMIMIKLIREQKQPS